MFFFVLEIMPFDPLTIHNYTIRHHFYTHLQLNLTSSGFLDPAYPKKLMERLRRLFGRARLEKEEVNILRGILTEWDKRMAEGRPDKVD